ncbi:MAG TPA: class I tRNA ligase family protein [Solirubrobacteraceae bacterium]|jgi:leucyl-tRNA synthetase|nr:class I tRNA ligase family protein [Solirubrobacteraceae bacterium]
MNSRAFPSYDPHAIEARRQAAWREREAFATPSVASDRPRRYIKPSAPFTSGNIHIGHVRSYSIGDAYARFQRARGEDVLFAFGFDAFGLPAELGAIERGESPGDWVARCAEHMTGQLQRLGFSFDWGRTFMSSEAIMYRWSQWLFLTLLDAGLVYRGTGAVDWCDTCQTTLATIQVEDGECWRCHNPVRLIERPTWYLRISAYVPENDRRLGELTQSGRWDEVALASQRFVLGRVDGVEVDLTGTHGARLTVFTPHADALAQARFVLISPKHPDIDVWASDPQVREQLEELRCNGLERSSREAGAIALIDTGRTLPAPTRDGSLPVLISPGVDGRFGATAVFGVPERDRTDEVIAERLADLLDGSSRAGGTEPSSTGASTGEAYAPREAVRYKAEDFSISRQRSWGTPIPIVYCDGDCGVVPIPVEQLPVVLPLDLVPTGAGNPLAEREDFLHTTCPSCGGSARRETDTLDCHFDALWLWVPVCVPPAERERPLDEIFALEDLRAWLPCERVVAGSDSGNFVFDQRIVTKALRDIGPLAFLADGEPFAGCLFHEMVISDGRKMSKHLGNVVDPDALVERYGADTVRLAVLYAARPQKTLNWSESAVLRAHRFLTQVWEFSQSRLAASEQLAVADGHAPTALADGELARERDAAGQTVRDTTEHLRLKLGQWREKAAEKITQDMQDLEMHSAVRNVMRLFDRIRDFEKRVLARGDELSAADRDALLGALAMLAQLLSPLAPHIAEELWIALGHDGDAQTPWPGVSSQVPA